MRISPTKSQKKKPYGFSLIEILLALALLEMVLLGTMVCFSQAHRLASKNRTALQALFIAENIGELLKATTPQGLIAIGPDWENKVQDFFFFSLETASQYGVAYDMDGQPKRLLSEEEYCQPFHEEGVCALAHLKIAPIEGTSGLVQATITVSMPANLSEKERQHFEHSLLLSTLSRYEMATD